MVVTELTLYDYQLLTPDERLIARRLVALTPGEPVSWPQFARGMSGHYVGARLRELHRYGFVVRHGRPTGLKAWEASPAWRALSLEMASQAVGSSSRLLLQAPPNLTDPDRFELVHGFGDLRRRLEFFHGRYWAVHVYGPVHRSHSLHLWGRVTRIEEDRVTEIWARYPDQGLIVQIGDGGNEIYLSRRAFKRALYDRCMQELQLEQLDNEQTITFEFVPDGEDG